MLIAHFFRLALVLKSSHPAQVHAIPSQTIKRTPVRSAMKINHLIICAIINWNGLNHFSTEQLYFLFFTGVFLHNWFFGSSHTHDFSSCPDSKYQHSQSTQGISSVTITFWATHEEAYRTLTKPNGKVKSRTYKITLVRIFKKLIQFKDTLF